MIGTEKIICLAAGVLIALLCLLKKSFTLPAAFAAAGLLGILALIEPKFFYGICIAYFLLELLEKVIGKDRADEALTRKNGPRDLIQLGANGGAALLFAVLYAFLSKPFLIAGVFAALGEALCDSSASAVGAHFRGKTFDCAALVPVEPGVSGGVSLAGTFASLISAYLMGTAAYLLRALAWQEALMSASFAFFAAFFDSYLGAAFQRRNRCEICGAVTEKDRHCGVPTLHDSGLFFLNNDAVNFASTLFASVFCVSAAALWEAGVFLRALFLFSGAVLILFLSSALHEIGHLIGCACSGSRALSVRIPLFSMTFRPFCVRLSGKEKSNCLFSAPNRTALFWVALAGPLMNLALAFFSFFGFFHSGYFLFAFAGGVNILKAAQNLIPGKRNDGHLIRQALQKE